MGPDPFANLFKRSSYDEPIPSDLDALDYLYKLLPKTRRSENCDEVLHDRSLNKKRDWNDFMIKSFNVNYANNMQNPKLGDDSFAMSSNCCNDHDWGDSSYDFENYVSPMMNMRLIIVFAIILKVGLEDCKL